MCCVAVLSVDISLDLCDIGRGQQLYCGVEPISSQIDGDSNTFSKLFAQVAGLFDYHKQTENLSLLLWGSTLFVWRMCDLTLIYCWQVERGRPTRETPLMAITWTGDKSVLPTSSVTFFLLVKKFGIAAKTE